MYYTRKVLRTSFDKIKYSKLLEKFEITYTDAEFSIGIFDGDNLIGAISLDNNCIKQICIEEAYQGEGIAASLVSEVISYANSKNVFELFVFTKPIYECLFNSMGFKTIIKNDTTVFLENKEFGIESYCNGLKEHFVDKERIGSLVMNLNPITNGHMYLIESATACCDHVHLFLVKEDKSSFPYEVRLRLLKECVKHIDNLTIHSGSEYIISSTTFPTYFLKNREDIDTSYPLIDANIFASYIAKSLNINVRFVGDEPYSKTTKTYNEVLKQVLPNFNIEVVELDRISFLDEIISASKVRELIRNNNLECVKDFVPDAVYAFLESSDASEIINNIRNNENRH